MPRQTLDGLQSAEPFTLLHRAQELLRVRFGSNPGRKSESHPQGNYKQHEASKGHYQSHCPIATAGEALSPCAWYSVNSKAGPVARVGIVLCSS